MADAARGAQDAPADDPVLALGGAAWRGTDAAEAQRVTLDVLGDGHWPVLPELADRGPGADPTGRSAALLAEVSVDLQPHGWRVSPPSTVASGMDRRRARSFWREDLRRWADLAGERGTVPDRVAVRVRGPLTLLGELWLPSGERALVDAGARRDLAESYREGLREVLAEVRAATGVPRVGLVLDEPLAVPVLAGRLPTASGYRTVRSLPRDEARGHWRAALADLVAAGVRDLWLTPGAGEEDVVDLALLAAEALPPADDVGRPPVALAVAVGALDGPRAGERPGPTPTTPQAWEVVAGWAAAGRRLALRAAGPDLLEPRTLLEAWDRLGLDPVLAGVLTLTVAGPQDARTLTRLRGVAEELAERVGDHV